MATYDVAILSQISELENLSMHQGWFADNGAFGGSVQELCKMWDRLCCLCRLCVYHPIVSKSWLLSKPSTLGLSLSQFQDTNINLMQEDYCYLGSVNGSKSYVRNCLEKKIVDWMA